MGDIPHDPMLEPSNRRRPAQELQRALYSSGLEARGLVVPERIPDAVAHDEARGLGVQDRVQPRFVESAVVASDQGGGRCWHVILNSRAIALWLVEVDRFDEVEPYALGTLLFTFPGEASVQG